MGWYLIILLVLALISAVLLYMEDHDALSKRQKANLPLYPLDSTAPQDFSNIKQEAKKFQSSD